MYRRRGRHRLMQQQQQQQQRDPEVSLRILVLPAPPRRTSERPAGRAAGRPAGRASSSVIDCIRALTRLAPHCTALPLARSLVRPLSLTASPARLSSISPIDWACESYRLLSTHCLSNSLASCFARCPFIALCDLKHVSAYRPLSAYRKYRLIGAIITPLS